MRQIAAPRTVRALVAPLRTWQLIALLLVATRLALTIAGTIGVVVRDPNEAASHLAPGLPPLELWAQWDSFHYVRIATAGYSYEATGVPNVPFFPLYPLLIRVVLIATGSVNVQTATLVGFLIANVALFIALLYLAALVARDFSRSTAWRTVIYLLVFPTTLFLSAVYAESLFLATAAAALYHARCGQWYRAGVAGALAAVTRPYGFLLAVPIAIEMFRQRPSVRALPAICLVPVGLAAYIAFLWWRFGSPLVYFEANERWGRGFYDPLSTLLNYIQGPLRLFNWPYSVLDLVSVAGMLVVVAAGLRLIPRSYWAYAATGLLFALSSGIAWYSASRHALSLFPVVVILAVIGERRRIFEWVWLLLSAVLALGFMTRFSAGYWVA